MCKKSNKINDNFIERKKYRAGVSSKYQIEKTTKEFYNNINDSQYIICVRGGGNFSVRFYEALAMGRIPVFINTDCILPLIDKINWNENLVWIESSEIISMPKKIMSFHNKLNNKTLEAQIKKNRKTWEDFLTLDGYFKHFLIR